MSNRRVLVLATGLVSSCSHSVPSDLPDFAVAASPDFAVAASPDFASCPTDYASDPYNCGRCGHSCLGGKCKNGKCQPVTLDGTCCGGPGALIVDGDSVYWSVESYGLNKVPKMGGLPTNLFFGNRVFGLTIDAKDLYWTYEAVGIQSIPRAGGAATTLLGDQDAYALVSDAADLYWSESLWSSSTGVRAMHRDGTNIRTVSVVKGFLALDPDNIYVATSVDIRRIPKAGGPEVVLAMEHGGKLAVYDKALYWTVTMPDAIRTVATSGGTVTTIATRNAAVMGIAVDAGAVYWCESGRGADSIVAAAKPDGAPVILTSSLPGPPYSIAIDDDAIYWASGGPGYAGTLLQKIAKP